MFTALENVYILNLLKSISNRKFIKKSIFLKWISDKLPTVSEWHKNIVWFYFTLVKRENGYVLSDMNPRFHVPSSKILAGQYELFFFFKLWFMLEYTVLVECICSHWFVWVFFGLFCKKKKKKTLRKKKYLWKCGLKCGCALMHSILMLHSSCTQNLEIP